jgi:hypothetical protein
MRYKYWIFLLAVLLLAACSGDGDSGQPGSVPDIPSPTPGNPDNPSKPDVTDSPLQLISLTRAALPGGVHMAGDDTKGNEKELSPIQIFLTGETGNNKREGQIIYDEDEKKWTSSIGVKDDPTCLYGFAPATVASCTINPLDGKTSYLDGAKLTLSNINSVTGDDLCAIVGVQHRENAITNPDWTTADGFLGVFSFNKKSNNYISLLLDHLYGRIDFKFYVGEEYSQWRIIKVKKVELLSTTKVTGLTVNLMANKGNHPIADDGIKYEYSTVAAGVTGVLYDSSTDTDTNGKQLQTVNGDAVVIPGFFAPVSKEVSGLSLVCTYDVYTIVNNNIGTRVRENCTATNKLQLIPNVQRGKKWTVNLTVEPTYLYQLSDDELDNPTVIVSSQN